MRVIHHGAHDTRGPLSALRFVSHVSTFAPAMAPSPLHSGTPAPEEPPPPSTYTAFTLRQRRLLTLLLGFTAIISPLTATIYFPLLPLLAQRLHISAQATNLTITIYIVFQAISPAIFGPLSDSLGRRIAYLVTLTLYVLSNVGLAVVKNHYVALIVLRAVQSLGASAAFAISYGVVADVCVPSERGSMVGPLSMALNLGTCVGPIVGGLVAYKSSAYDWVFWFLVIIGVVLLVSIGSLLPETARSLVGDGGFEVRAWWEHAWLTSGKSALLRGCKKDSGISTAESAVSNKEEGSPRQVRANEPTNARRRVNFVNPLLSVTLMVRKDIPQILLLHGMNYMVDYSIQTSIPSAYRDLFHYNDLQIGFSYLPRGAGIIIGGYANGKLMDWNYEVTARKNGYEIYRQGGDDIDHFPIERARTRGSWLISSLMALSVLSYGWALQYKAHVSIVLCLQFVQGFLGTSIYTFSSTLLVDILPETPSTAAAAASIIRCAFAAIGTATVQPLVDAIGRGWYFTILGTALGTACNIAIWVIRTWGMEWRNKRRQTP